MVGFRRIRPRRAHTGSRPEHDDDEDGALSPPRGRNVETGGLADQDAVGRGSVFPRGKVREISSTRVFLVERGKLPAHLI